MAIVRGSRRPVLFIGIVSCLATSHVADAFFGGAFNKLFNKVEGIMDNVQESVQKFSVLSNVFGDGVTRGDLSLPEIINGAFSRNNGIFVADSTSKDMDWKLGDGSNVVAAISSGGSIGVSTANGQVTLTTAKNPADEKTEDNKECEDSEGGDGCREEKENVEKGDAEVKTEEGEVDEGAGKNNTQSFEGEDMDQAFYKLIENWDEFVSSSIWGVQDKEGGQQLPVPSSEAEGEQSMETSERVVNGIFYGNGVPSGAAFAVKFFYNDEKNFYCSGSLIGYPYVLTAAHCGIVDGDTVRVGGRLLRSGYEATVAEVILHPNFDPGNLVHDVAIVRLSDLADKEILMDNGVKAARVNKNKNFPKKDFVGVLSGHGSVEQSGRGVSDELRTTRHKAFDISKCQDEITQGSLNKEKSYLCAGDGERSTTCVGDSGAGMWHYRIKETPSGKTRKFYEIFGVVSFGEVTDKALCPRGPPTVFQRTAGNYDWIVGVVGKKNMP